MSIKQWLGNEERLAMALGRPALQELAGNHDLNRESKEQSMNGTLAWRNRSGARDGVIRFSGQNGTGCGSKRQLSAVGGISKKFFSMAGS